MYKRMLDLPLGTRKQEIREEQYNRIMAAKESEYTYLCRKGAAAPPLSLGELNWDCLPGNLRTSIILRNILGQDMLERIPWHHRLR